MSTREHEELGSERNAIGIIKRWRATAVSEHATAVEVTVQGDRVRLRVEPEPSAGVLFLGGSIELHPTDARHIAELLLAAAADGDKRW